MGVLNLGGDVAEILLLIDHDENRRMLADALSGTYEVVTSSTDAGVDGEHDLIVVDGRALDRHREGLSLRKRQDEPVFLPVLLISSRPDVSSASHVLWQVVDDVVTTPVGKAELQARVAQLLRSRRLSLALKSRNEDLQMFIQALGHDLRAPARYAGGFAQALREDYGDALDQQGHHYLDRIDGALRRIRDFLDLLLEYGRLGHAQTVPRPVLLEDSVQLALMHLESSISMAEAEVQFDGPCPIVWGDPELLDLVIDNLLSNAIKFAAPGVRPKITISTGIADGMAWLEVTDNGIGIPADALDRIFEPLIRLHGEESYAGKGLGLAIARRAVGLMGGEIQVRSILDEGSTFRLTLPLYQGENV